MKSLRSVFAFSGGTAFFSASNLFFSSSSYFFFFSSSNYFFLASYPPTPARASSFFLMASSAFSSTRPSSSPLLHLWSSSRPRLSPWSPLTSLVHFSQVHLFSFERLLCRHANPSLCAIHLLFSTLHRSILDQGCGLGGVEGSSDLSLWQRGFPRKLPRHLGWKGETWLGP